MTQNKLPPVTEEDMPAVKKMIERLIRMRKREAMHSTGSYSIYDEFLGDAIKELCKYGEYKQWWKDQDPYKWKI